jgi:hypothetical protein
MSRIITEDENAEAIFIKPSKSRVRMTLSVKMQDKLIRACDTLDELFEELKINNSIDENSFTKKIKNPLDEFIAEIHSSKKGKLVDKKPNPFAKHIDSNKRVKALFRKCFNENIVDHSELTCKDDAKTCMYDINKVLTKYIEKNNLKDKETKLIQLDDYLKNLLRDELYRAFVDEVQSETFKHNRISTVSKYLLK